MAKAKNEELAAVWQQNTQLGFTTADGTRYRVVDFHEEMTALQDEELIALVGDVLPAVNALDNNSTEQLAALSVIIETIAGDKALLRRALAVLFLPENDRVFRRADVEQRMELLGNLPNRQFLPLLESIKDFFAFAGKSFPTASATFLTKLAR
jgi:hypothetical protein